MPMNVSCWRAKKKAVLHESETNHKNQLKYLENSFLVKSSISGLLIFSNISEAVGGVSCLEMHIFKTRIHE